MREKKGKILSITGNMITVLFEDNIIQNEVGHVISGQERLMAEVIRIHENTAFMQVFESTRGLKVNDEVEFTGEMLSVQLGPGLLGKIFDGLQNPLPDLAQRHGFFLQRGVSLDGLDFSSRWHFIPEANVGDVVGKGMPLGYVPEGIFKHYIMAPFYLEGEYTVSEVAPEGEYGLKDKIARLKDVKGNSIEVTMTFNWPVKLSIEAYRQQFLPKDPMVTKVRILDTFFPVAKGGTYCIPGPFGAGKTVLQQITSRYAEVDIVVVAACGERAGEVVETLRKFPDLIDPRTGKPLMERTIIICNTSSMPVAARDASVYTAATLGEYYRQMGLDVLLLADSTSRWAQAMREISGRLEEIPGEEAYPAYLESRIAEFYERAGLVELPSGQKGSLTIGGTVSPAGGNFEEPVTQATLKVVGAFHGLSRDRANARKFPSVDPLDSWTKYESFIPTEKVKGAKKILFKGNEVGQMMKVVGEEGTSLEDFLIYLKAEFLDGVYLQQNAFDEVDAATSPKRQEHVFNTVCEVLHSVFSFKDKEEAREFFYTLRHMFIDWNYTDIESDKFKQQENKIAEYIKEKLATNAKQQTGVEEEPEE